MTQSQITVFISTLTVSSVVFLDRLTKIFFSKILLVGESLPVIRNVFHFTLVHNTGIAFGLFKNYGFLFIFISLIAIAVFAFNLYYHKDNHKIGKIEILAFSLVMGGAVGNLIDRLAFGYVIDFLDFRIWPVFNVADSAITIGTIIILFKCIPFFSK